MLLGYFIPSSVFGLVFIGLMIFIILAMNVRPIVLLNEKSYLFLLLLSVTTIRLIYLGITFGEEYKWDNGSNNGQIFTDGDFIYYYILTNSILSSWEKGNIFSVLISYLPEGINGLVYAHLLSLINVASSFNTTFNSYAEVALFQLLILHAVRIIFVIN